MNAVEQAGATLMDQLVKQVALKTGTPVQIVDQVIRHQWKTVTAATKEKSSIELSGIGYLVCSPTKVRRRLTKAQRILESYRKRLAAASPGDNPGSLPARIATCHEVIEKLSKRIRDEDRLEGVDTGNVQLRVRKRLDQTAGGTPL